MIDYILSIFFPQHCPYCQKVISRNLFECDDCRIQFPKFPRIKMLPSGEKCIAPFVYDSSVRKAIVNYKFHNIKNNAKSFSVALYDTIKSGYDDIDFSVITCVPLSAKRMKERGFNQSEIVARKVAEKLNIKFDNLLVKIKDNREQHSLSAKERVENIKGVYSVVDKSKVENQTILVIDDVVTTGNTLSECCKVLKENNAKQIFCASISIAGESKLEYQK